ncbi:MAG: extracellular solute-binding protein [Spirochaetales bacterium]|nr:extracellular solute-binding protein [Spirochaetales bacterium]
MKRMNLGAATFLCIVLFTMVCVAPVFGAGSQEPKTNADGKIEIVYWYPWTGESETFDLDRVAQFEEQNPQYDVIPVFRDGGGVLDGQLLAAMASGNAPDVVATNHYATAFSLIFEDALQELDPYMEEIGLKGSDISSTYRGMLQANDSYYLLPELGLVRLMLYDKVALEEAGLSTVDLPETIDELDAYISTLNKVSADGDIERIGFVPWLDDGADPILWAYMFGADVYDPATNKINVANDKMVDMLAWQARFAESLGGREKIDTFVATLGGAFSPDHGLMTGKTPIVLMGSWYTNALRIFKPELEYVVSPISAPEYGRVGGSMLTMNVFLSPKGAKNPKGGVEFAQFCGQPDIVAENINTWRSMSAYTGESDAIVWEQNGDPVWATMKEITSNADAAGHPILPPVSQQLQEELMSLRDAVTYGDIAVGDIMAELTRIETSLQAEMNKL